MATFNAKPTARLSAIVFAVAAAKLCLHLYAGRSYGFFVDELYYLACAKHLAWGYVDQPPLIALIAWITHALLGDSLSATRLPAALAGAAEVLLAGMLARELGGRRFAQSMAATAVLAAPAILGIDHFLSMNAFEPLLWMGCALVVLQIAKTGNAKLWLWFGVLAGIGMENKYSMAMFAGGLLLGVLLGDGRRTLATRWFWIAGAIAFALFLPNLVWNIQHGFPFLELQRNIKMSGRDVPLGVGAFFAQETLAMHPLALPVWLAGLWFCFAAKAGKPYRALGWAWLVPAVIIVAMSPRVYYLFPAFPLLFAAGSVWWETALDRPRVRWLQVAYPALLLATGALLAPIAIPVLSPEHYMAYTRTMHLAQPRIETHELGPLPQLFADQFGWPEMAASVAQVYRSLPPEVRTKTAIFAQSYGQAGAIDRFGPQFGLPPPICAHQSYFLWGPRNYTGESVIAMGGEEEKLRAQFASVRRVGRVSHPYSMPYNHIAIFYCEGLKIPLAELWPKLKRWS